MLADATQCGPFSGGSSGFFRPRSISAARVMLIGDALTSGPAERRRHPQGDGERLVRGRGLPRGADRGTSRRSMQRYADCGPSMEADWRRRALHVDRKNRALATSACSCCATWAGSACPTPSSASSPAASSPASSPRMPGWRSALSITPSRRTARPGRPPARERTGGRGRDRRRDLQPRRRLPDQRRPRSRQHGQGSHRQHGLGPRPGGQGGLAGAEPSGRPAPRGRRAAMTVHDVIVVGAGAGGSPRRACWRVRASTSCCSTSPLRRATRSAATG